MWMESYNESTQYYGNHLIIQTYAVGLFKESFVRSRSFVTLPPLTLFLKLAHHSYDVMLQDYLEHVHTNNIGDETKSIYVSKAKQYES